jgi:hypothetical protein
MGTGELEACKVNVPAAAASADRAGGTPPEAGSGPTPAANKTATSGMKTPSRRHRVRKYIARGT